MEIIYNKIDFNRIFAIAALIAGALLIMIAIGRRSLPFAVFAAMASALLLWQSCGYAMRWIIKDSIPLSNSAEALSFISIVIMALSIAIYRANRLLGALTLMAAGFAALVAAMAGANPAITPLMPVLASPWLGIHVALMMLSYATLTVCCILSAMALFARDGQILERYRAQTLCLLYPAVYLLALGIITGAVWADNSWGRYWGWDPKETWALITLMVYAVPLHTSAPLLKSHRAFHAYMAVAFAVLLMTFFGVNHLLGGLHSYA